jgi:hypothetical protein
MAPAQTCYRYTRPPAASSSRGHAPGERPEIGRPCCAALWTDQALDFRPESPNTFQEKLYWCSVIPIQKTEWPRLGGLDRQEERLKKGIQFLRARRDDEGGWQTFPFWHTVLLLSEIDLPGAKTELRYAAPELERAAVRSAATRYAERRRSIAARALANT